VKFAYVDPPYHGMGKKMYGELHSEAAKWDDKQSHIDLLARIAEEYPDGWVFSCNPKDLPWLLPTMPEGTRVGAWVKTFFQIRKVHTQYAWEPILFSGGRIHKGRNPMVYDWLSCPRNLKRGVPGAKPDKFNDWVIKLLNAQEGDEVVDVFPGSGGLRVACEKVGALYVPLTGSQ
jgi:hypothetical protein